MDFEEEGDPKPAKVKRTSGKVKDRRHNYLLEE